MDDRADVLGVIPDDGYSEPFVILGVPRLYPRDEGRFRPMVLEQLIDYWRVSEKLNELQIRKLVATYLAAQIEEWDLKDAKGEVWPLTQASMMRVKHKLFGRLFRMVSGDEAPDLEPGKPAEIRDEDLEAAIEAAKTGRPLHEVREDRQRGNSLAPSASS